MICLPFYATHRGYEAALKAQGVRVYTLPAQILITKTFRKFGYSRDDMLVCKLCCRTQLHLYKVSKYFSQSKFTVPLGGLWLKGVVLLLSSLCQHPTHTNLSAPHLVVVV